MKLAIIRCAVCDTPFRPVSRSAKYCGAKCRRRREAFTANTELSAARARRVIGEFRAAISGTSHKNSLYLPEFMIQYSYRERLLIHSEIAQLFSASEASGSRTSAIFMCVPRKEDAVKEGIMWAKCKSGTKAQKSVESLYYSDGQCFYSHICRL